MSNSAFGNTQGQDSVLTPDVLRRKRGLKWLIIAAMLIALALLAQPLLRYVSGESVRASELRFSTVTRGDLVREASGMGRVVAARAPSLYAENAGVVRFVTEAGAVVASGAVLAEMDSPELKSRLAQELSTLLALRSEAARQKVANQRATLAKTRELDTARITATAALREWQRAQAALAVRAISSVDHLRAKDALEASEILVRAAAADLALERESLRLELDNRAALVARQAQAVSELERQVAALKIVAPFAGVVGQLMVPDRSSVAANSAVLSVVDLAALELEVSVSEIYSADLAAGLNAEVELGAARLRAVVRLVSPEIKDGALTVRVRFADTQPADLRQNQRLNVRIQFDERKNVALVDRGAFVDAEGGRFAWQRVGDHLRRVAISTGSFSTEKIEITSGLKVGDVMVVSALPKKVLGDRVNLIE
jgi:HlyD family secretion protein